MNLELRHHRLFATVADCRSFSAAGRLLGMSQPSVSRGVAVIERRLGVRLVTRTTRRITLTPAGEVLAAEARLLLDAAAAAETLTVRAAEQRTLVVGIKADSAREFLSEVLGECGEVHRLHVELDFAETHLLPTAVRQGRCDVCLVAWPIAAPGSTRSNGLESIELWSEPRVAVLPIGHPLAVTEWVDIDAFAHEPVVRWPQLPAEFDRYYQGRDTLAREPDVQGPPATGLAEALRLVDLHRAVTFLPRSVAHRFARAEITTREVSGLSPSSMYLCWRDRPVNRDLRTFISVCRRIAEKANTTNGIGSRTPKNHPSGARLS